MRATPFVSGSQGSRSFPFLRGAFLLLVLLLASLWIRPADLRAEPREQGFLGTSPPVVDSQASLGLWVDPSTPREGSFSWQSTDPILGTVHTGRIAASTWNYWPASDTRPARLVFTGMGDGAAFRGNLLFGDYRRGVMDLVRDGRVRYLLIQPEIAWVTDDYEERDYAGIRDDPREQTYAQLPDQPGGPGGFGGPPAGTGFNGLAAPLRILDLSLSDTGNDVAGDMQLVLSSNVAIWSEPHDLAETAPGSDIFVDDRDTLALRVLTYPDLDPLIPDALQVYLVSNAFGTRLVLDLEESGPDSRLYSSDQLHLTVDLQRLPSPGTPDSLTAILESEHRGIDGPVALEETGADSLIFEDEEGSFRLRILRITDLGSGFPDELTALVDSARLGITEARLDALESGPDSLELLTSALRNAGPPGEGRGAQDAVGINAKWHPTLDFPAEKGWDLATDKVRAGIVRKRGQEVSDPFRDRDLFWLKDRFRKKTRDDGAEIHYHGLHTKDRKEIRVHLKETLDGDKRVLFSA